ncbi:MAG: hypothetical protein QF735_04820 [Phycisphaeraceae bacterium]|nr:hypothetical protein [Phycisphaeraceae bacterium]
MTYVVLLTLCSLGFQQLLRTAQVRRTNVLAVAAVNYMIAAVGSAVLYAFDRADAESISWVAVALGAVNGVLFATHLYIILASYRRAGVGITIAVTQCGGALAMANMPPARRLISTVLRMRPILSYRKEYSFHEPIGTRQHDHD